MSDTFSVGNSDLHNEFCVDANRNGVIYAMADNCTKEDAEFIVRACNSRDDLVRSLRELCDADDDAALESAMFVRARAAIARAEGKS